MNDLTRLKNEYADRARRLTGKNLYSWFNRANLFTIQQRQRMLISALLKAGIKDLAPLYIFEIGCGSGGILTEFLNFGAMPENLFGVDLLEDRLVEARRRLPASPIVNADGQRIPFPSQSFDIVMQFTAFSSILDKSIKLEIAKDMLRILKPGGFILWYDFWWNPVNPQTRGIQPKEIKELFPGCNYEFHKITLAPPIARRIAPVLWGGAMLLENLKIFNSHYLVTIIPKTSRDL